ncbi:MAG TPA: maleylpyruvate isomerase family mycothiol-dependent enzyme [Chloroflexota bacterium]|nr:maleylpyruvate isomerase family mycothiol-dependent enzyme [Chloroflexota bacterium]
MAEQPPIETIVRDSNRVSRAETQALVGELRAGGAAAWEAPTACPGWAAKHAVAHLVQALWFFNAATHAALDGQPPPPSEPALMDAAVAQLVAQPRESVLGLLAERNEAYCEYLDSLDVAALPAPVDLTYMVLPLWQLALLRMNELVLHRWDIRAARQPDAPVESEGVPMALEMSLGGAQIMATHGEKTDGTWQLDVAGPGGGPVTLRVQGDLVSATRGTAPGADVRLALASEALLRLLWGRLDLAMAIDSGRVRLDGDRAKALALQRLFPGA